MAVLSQCSNDHYMALLHQCGNGKKKTSTSPTCREIPLSKTTGWDTMRIGFRFVTVLSHPLLLSHSVQLPPSFLSGVSIVLSYWRYLSQRRYDSARRLKCVFSCLVVIAQFAQSPSVVSLIIPIQYSGV